MPNPNELFEWVQSLQDKGQMPTFRDAMEQFGCDVDAVDEAINDYNDYSGDGYICALVAFHGGGVRIDISDPKDYIIEACSQGDR